MRWRIEAERPADLSARRYALTTTATEESNALEGRSVAAGSETGTTAREETAADFRRVASAYGSPAAGLEALVAARAW